MHTTNIGGKNMKFKIYGTVDGVEDSIIIFGNTVEECREKTKIEVEKRKWKDCWSEQI